MCKSSTPRFTWYVCRRVRRSSSQPISKKLEFQPSACIKLSKELLKMRYAPVQSAVLHISRFAEISAELTWYDPTLAA
eukprot:4045865-Prymnesium_polylepis.1